jgi:hypothetical protein
MKTIADIQRDIDELISELNNPLVDDKDKKKGVGRLTTLREMKMYMETDPREQFILDEIEQHEAYIDKCNEAWETKFAKDKMEKLPSASISKMKREFFKDLGIEASKIKIKNLRYLIS